MKPVGSTATQSTRTIKSKLKRFVTFAISWGLLTWALMVLVKLSLTVFQSNDTIGLSLLGGLIMSAYILVRKELQRW